VCTVRFILLATLLLLRLFYKLWTIVAYTADRQDLIMCAKEVVSSLQSCAKKSDEEENVSLAILGEGR
jgi:hypothetical protein